MRPLPFKRDLMGLSLSIYDFGLKFPEWLCGAPPVMHMEWLIAVTTIYTQQSLRRHFIVL
jgi:hypothetical protein